MRTGKQIARVRGVHLPSQVRAALIACGRLAEPGADEPLAKSLGYPFGAHWSLPGPLPQTVVSISLREEEGGWLLTIEPNTPLRPEVVIKTPHEGQGERLAEECFRVAQELHRYLEGTFEDIRWALDADPDAAAHASEPIPP